MSDLIKLLPDAIANQIAAGEVVQRPASAAKELLENAIDAGATDITLAISDGGQTMVQVIDNGSGMSETDARMCWERHATSKIRKTEDLFNISSFGFRGEALASIAAVAQVELKTRSTEREVGTRIQIEASEVLVQEPVACPVGTTITVKNLFFNIPARRNFLKSVAVETRHLIEEFQRVALANPGISFRMLNNGKELYKLRKSDLQSRIETLLGGSKKGELIPIEEETDILKVHGFVGSPEKSKKTRGDQFFFVNGRYIREPYFNHAIMGAFEGLIESDHHPFYVLYLEIDPARIDINVHPTKTEVKFEDAKSIYQILRSIVKKALSGFHNTPELDFDRGPELWGGRNPISTDNERSPKAPEIRSDRSYNPFGRESNPKGNLAQWEQLYGTFKHEPHEEEEHVEQLLPDLLPTEDRGIGDEIFQFQNAYIVCAIKDKLYLVDQNAAHQRVLFEKYMAGGKTRNIPSQQLLFPRTIEFTPADFTILSELIDEINALGFDIHIFGKNAIIVNGTPADISNTEVKDLLEGLLGNYQQNQQELKLDKRESLARAMAWNSAIRHGHNLSRSEMKQLINDLLACEHPLHSPAGKSVFITFVPEQLESLLKK